MGKTTQEEAERQAKMAVEKKRREQAGGLLTGFGFGFVSKLVVSPLRFVCILGLVKPDEVSLVLLRVWFGNVGLFSLDF